MKYFALRDDFSIENRWHISDIGDTKGAETQFLDGKSLSPQGPLRARVGTRGRSLPFSVSSFGGPMANEKLSLAMVDASGDELQRFPVDIEGYSGFFALNATRTIRCLDESRTEFTKWTTADHRADLAGEYRMVIGVRILADLVPHSTSCFRIEGWTVVLVVSERLREAMERAGCEGAVFREV